MKIMSCGRKWCVYGTSEDVNFDINTLFDIKLIDTAFMNMYTKFGIRIWMIVYKTTRYESCSSKFMEFYIYALTIGTSVGIEIQRYCLGRHIHILSIPRRRERRTKNLGGERMINVWEWMIMFWERQ